MLLLRNVHGEETVFQGQLYVEKTIVCAVIQDASNPDEMEVKIVLDYIYKMYPLTI
jgi:hypothetical protein